MRLNTPQLKSTLEKKVGPLYLISGDEPLQVGEVADAIRRSAYNAGYKTREILSTEAGFKWNELALATNTISLFSDKTFIDLRIASAKLGVEGSKAFLRYCQRLSKNTLLLITMPKLDKAILNTKWFQAVDKVGIVIQLWPQSGKALLQWLGQRAKQRGLHIDSEGIKTLASYVEGNLLAAAQEIEKLYILHGESFISTQLIEQSVADSSRFDVFKLTECVLAGHINRAIKILNSLKAEGLAAPIILWALTRDTRLLLRIKTAINKGQSIDVVLNQNRLWYQRKTAVSIAISRLKTKQLAHMLELAAQADRQIKGVEQGDHWETLLAYCALFCAKNENNMLSDKNVFHC